MSEHTRLETQKNKVARVSEGGTTMGRVGGGAPFEGGANQSSFGAFTRWPARRPKGP